MSAWPVLARADRERDEKASFSELGSQKTYQRVVGSLPRGTEAAECLLASRTPLIVRSCPYGTVSGSARVALLHAPAGPRRADRGTRESLRTNCCRDLAFAPAQQFAADAARIYPRRAAGRDRDHRRAGGAVAAGRASVARKRPPQPHAPTICGRSASACWPITTRVGAFPPGLLDRKTSSKPKARQLAWSVLLLPYHRRRERLSTCSIATRPTTAPQNRAAGGTVIPIYLCPSTVRLAAGRTGDTAGDVNRNGLWDPGDDLAFTDYGGNFGFSGLNRPFMNGVLICEQRDRRSRRSPTARRTRSLVAEDTGRGAVDGRSVGQRREHLRRSGPINDRSLPEYRWQDNEMWSDHPGGAKFCCATARSVFCSSNWIWKFWPRCAPATAAKCSRVRATDTP